jgi:beta-N-acetylhexosaminidase
LPVRLGAAAAVLTVTLTAGVAGPATAGTTPRHDGASRVLAGMSLPERVGQVFMVGTPAAAVSPATARALTRYHVGGAMLTGRSDGGVAATARVTARLQGLAPAGVKLYVATDQEGGTVQVLSGPGFAEIPGAVVQGRAPAPVLRQRAQTWGRQLRAAGVNLDLGPVVDTVPRALSRSNAPIGALGRQYGDTPGRVGRSGAAFTEGMDAAGVDVTLKHFPGLGRVRGNTDHRTRVVDRVTTRRDPYVAPFAAGIRAGAQFVMPSSAYYARIDPRRPAAFSPVVLEDMLRDDLGFTGVVISDDLGNAAQVQPWSPGERALKFLLAGGDLVLTVNPDLLAPMYRAVLARARTDARFRARVEEAALRVLRRKQASGLLAPPMGRWQLDARGPALRYGDAATG